MQRDAEEEVATRRLVQRALALAEEARFLEDADLITEAVEKYAQAVTLLLEPSETVAALRPHVEHLLMRAEKLRAEQMWSERVQVRTLYQGDNDTTSQNNHVYLQTEPKGVGTFVSQGHPSYPLVACVQKALTAACELDSSCLPGELVPALLHAPDDELEFDKPEPFSVTLQKPAIFRQLRSNFRLPLHESIGTQGMFMLGSPGKSGSFLFFTADMQVRYFSCSNQFRFSLFAHANLFPVSGEDSVS